MNIENLLKQKKITKVQLAEKMGISREYLYKVLSGEPSSEMIKKLADALGETETAMKSLALLSSCMEPIRKSTLVFFPFEQWRINKQICIVAPASFERESEIGYFMYERPISHDYKMRERGEEDELSYYMNSHKPEYYPHDYVDTVLLDMVRQKFPKSFVRNFTVLSNSDAEHVKYLQQPNHKTISLRITPRITVEMMNARTKYEYILQDVKLYESLYSVQIENIFGFHGTFDIGKEEKLFNTMNNVNLRFL